MDRPIYDLSEGDGPLLLNVPHAGTGVPDTIRARLTAAAQRLPDTDWHIPRLYDFASGLGATTLVARNSRYVVDLNRPPTGESLYPGRTTTGLCPVALFSGAPLYEAGGEPDEAEINDRVDAYWRPYHDELGRQLARIKAKHGYALLFDAHSIRSRVPRLFEGRLADFNLGTAKGKSCGAAFEQAALGVLEACQGFSWVANGSFIGGFITRHYGAPGAGIHALQMEQSQITYMEEDWPFAYDAPGAATAQAVLRDLIRAVLNVDRAENHFEPAS
jgi:N-formylglutamate amidohydrolase